MRKLSLALSLLSVFAAGAMAQTRGMEIPKLVAHDKTSVDVVSAIALRAQSRAKVAGNQRFADEDLVPAEVIQKHAPQMVDDIAVDPVSNNTPVSNPFLQVGVGPPNPATAAVPGTGFDGLGTGFAGYGITGAPPDTTLAVGPNHIVQWVNSHFAIFNKSGTALLPAPGFAAGNTIWAGFGGNLCQTTNRGDPLVLYDRLADRWIFSQFAFNVSGSNPAPPFLQCIAVTQGSSPAGPYNRYAFQFTQFNDYGKMGVWPAADGYFFSYNMFNPATNFTNTGAQLCGYNRGDMLSGVASPRAVCTPIAFYGGGASLLPSDQDGPISPPANTPAYFLRQSTVPALRLFKFLPNWNNLLASTFNDGFGGVQGSFVNLPLGTTDRACAGGTCIPQLGTANRLDTLADRLMYRLAYRQVNGVESLIVSQSVDPDGAGAQISGIRWYEIRNPGAPAAPAPAPNITLFQNSTYAPDATARWMGSGAMDKVGNMLFGYSASSVAQNPSIRVAGRLRSEVRNRLQAESVVIQGTGSQTGTLTRWGDYSTMSVDPADDCTFWYTTEYLSANGAFNWRTRIASFKFPNCVP